MSNEIDKLLQDWIYSKYMFNEFYSINDHDIYGDELELEVYLESEGYGIKLAMARYKYGSLIDDNSAFDTNFIYSSNINYIVRALTGYQESGYVNIQFAITAQFPN